MAKVLFTALMADMRGKMNGSVLARNKGGNYMRTKVTPLNPRSPGQVIARQRLGSLSSMWRGLTPEQRNGWTAATAAFPRKNVFGNTYLLTGAQLFTSMNTNLLTIGTSVASDAPVPVEFDEYIISGFNDASGLFGPIMSGPVPADFSLVVEATPPVSPGKTFVQNLYKQVQVFNAAHLAGCNILAAYTALYNAPVSGQVVGVRATLINFTTGQKGTPSEILHVVA